MALGPPVRRQGVGMWLYRDSLWKPRVVLVTTLSSHVAQEIVVMTTWGAVSHKFDIITALAFSDSLHKLQTFIIVIRFVDLCIQSICIPVLANQSSTQWPIRHKTHIFTNAFRQVLASTNNTHRHTWTLCAVHDGCMLRNAVPFYYYLLHCSSLDAIFVCSALPAVNMIRKSLSCGGYSDLSSIYRKPQWGRLSMRCRLSGVGIPIIKTNWIRDKLTVILQTTLKLYAFYRMKMCDFQLKFLWSLYPEVLINDISALVQIMAWCRPGDKPLS